MDKITHEVRLTRWTRLVEQCQSRPEGQTISQWCKEAGFGEKTYYYWQRRARLHCAAQIAGDFRQHGRNQMSIQYVRRPKPTT